jgi:arylsulfatase A-like enzyme
MNRQVLLCVCALAFGQVPACARPERPNLIIVVIDTLRPDRLGAYGSQRNLSPFLDSLADRSVVFQNAYAQTSWTNASIASLLTSRYQSQHRVTSFTSVLAAHEVTLTEILRDNGYATGGFNANFLVNDRLGFDQGFDRYQVFWRLGSNPVAQPRLIKERAERINSAALEWLDEALPRRQPIFLYLHYMEPHHPYDPPDEIIERVLDGRPRPDSDEVNLRMRMPNLGHFSDDIVQAVKDLYDAEVMSLDAQLRRMFAELGRRGLLDNAVVVILSDHGEEFREHGLMGHHQTLFEEVIRVPLIITLPGERSRVEVAAIVSLTDVAPTLLDLAGISIPSSFEGASLRPLMGVPESRRWWPLRWLERTQPSRPRANVAFSELLKETTNRERPHERAVVTRSRKLIVNVDGGREYYDLRVDPGEMNPDGLPEPARAELGAALSRLHLYGAGQPTPQAKLPMDADTRERMRALGYTE